MPWCWRSAVGALTMSVWLARHPLARRVGHRLIASVAVRPA